MTDLKIKLLKDKSRLQEIYEFRAKAWGNSPSKNTINTTLFPKGWFDAADENSLLWYSTDSSDRVIATARLNYFNSLEDAFKAGMDLNKYNIPSARPFGLLSRLAIDFNYRGMGIAHRFDQIRIDQLKKDNVEFAVVEVNNKRVKPLESLGFRLLGNIDFSPSKKGDSEILNLMIFETNIVIDSRPKLAERMEYLVG